MAIQNNFPAIKPTLLLDFANTEELDSRITFTRASTATYYGTQTVAAGSKPTGEMEQTDEGEVPVMAALEGHHVNVRVVGEDPTPLQAFAVTPTLPVRVWG